MCLQADIRFNCSMRKIWDHLDQNVTYSIAMLMRLKNAESRRKQRMSKQKIRAEIKALLLLLDRKENFSFMDLIIRFFYS